jgi:hypothetical protein
MAANFDAGYPPRQKRTLLILIIKLIL